mgnify:CR=1 FL=1
MGDLTVRPGFLASLLKAVGLVKVLPDGKLEHSAGADFVEDTAFRSGYDPKAAMSALSAFPWPYSCVQALSTDLSRVPLKAYRGTGADAEVLNDHPILQLLKQPSSRVNGVLFRRQLYTDMILTGNAFVLLAGSGNRVDALIRLHPSRVQIAPLSDGQPDKYLYDSGHGLPAEYDHSVVLHVRAPSWSDDPSNLWGTGAVQPLHNDLTTEKHQAELASRTAATGQPSGILSPKEEGDRWSKEQIKTLRSAYEHQMKSGGSGVLILGGQAQFDKLQITPREMEFSQVRDFVRASTIAAFGCVPVRLGLETANYAQSRNQLQLYWESLQGRAALVDAELTRLARIMGDEDVTIEHDFSEVESLQESRTERLNRVMEWQMLGIPTEDAAAYEGFNDLPVPDQITDGEVDAPVADGDTTAPADAPAPTEEPLAATALNGAQVSSLLTILEQVALGAITADAAVVLIGVAFPTVNEEQARRIVEGASAAEVDPDAPEQPIDDELAALVEGVTREAEDAVWKQWANLVQGPVENEIQLSMLRYLRGYAARIAKRIPKVVSKMTASGDVVIRAEVEGEWLNTLMGASAERPIFNKALRDAVDEAWTRGADAALIDMGEDLADQFVYDTDLKDKQVDEQLAEMLGVRSDGTIEAGITATTRDKVRNIVLTAIEAGDTIADMQKAMMAPENPAFNASRALKIARTESTRSVNAAGVNAWEQMAAEADVELELKWKAQPGARSAHANLNGVARGDDGYWEVDGAKASAPGGFGVGSLDINCRCTFLPSVKT